MFLYANDSSDSAFKASLLSTSALNELTGEYQMIRINVLFSRKVSGKREGAGLSGRALFDNLLAICLAGLLSGCFEAREFNAEAKQRYAPVEALTRWYAYEFFGEMNVRPAERFGKQRYVDIEPLGSCYLVDQHDGNGKSYMTAFNTLIPNFWALVKSKEDCNLNDTLDGTVMGLVKSRGIAGTSADYYLLMSLEAGSVNSWAEELDPEIRKTLNILPLKGSVGELNWSIGSAMGLSLMISQNAGAVKFMDTAYSPVPGQCATDSKCTIGM